MRTYPQKKTRARKKTKKLSQKQREALALKKKKAQAAKKGWATRRANARKKESKKRSPAKKPSKKSGASKKKPKKLAAATKATPKKKRLAKNAKVRAKVKANEKRRERTRRKSLTPKKRRKETAAVREEKRRIEVQRLLEEKLHQIREEEQRQRASKTTILDALKQRFGKLLEEAKRTKQLPPLPRVRTINSDRWIGTKWNVSINKVLTEDMVPEVMHRVRSYTERLVTKKGYGWMAVIIFASLGESLLGYGSVVLSSSLPGASLFQTQGIESTGTMNTKEGMLMKLEEKLETLAGEKSSTVYVNFITVSTYGSKR